MEGPGDTQGLVSSQPPNVLANKGFFRPTPPCPQAKGPVCFSFRLRLVGAGWAAASFLLPWLEVPQSHLLL